MVRACIPAIALPSLRMTLPDHPVILTVEQIAGLNRELSKMRHEINNHLSVVLAAVELIRIKPDLTESMVAKVLEQPARTKQAIQEFSAEFEKTFGIRHD